MADSLPRRPKLQNKVDWDSISSSSDEPSFYSDPFQSYKVQPKKGLKGNAAELEVSLPARSSPRQPYPVSIRAYRPRDYEYVSSFSRSTKAGLRVTRSDAELLNPKNVILESDSDFSTSSSSTGFRSNEGSSFKTGISTESNCNLQSNTEQQLEERSISPGGEHTDVSAEFKEEEEGEHLDVSADSYSGLQLGMEGCDTSSAKLEEQPPQRKNEFSSDDEFFPLSKSIKDRSQIKFQQTEHLHDVLPEFATWDTPHPNTAERYTDKFDSLGEQKKAGGLPVSGSPPRLKSAVSQGTNIQQPALHRQRWQFKWRHCFAASRWMPERVIKRP